MIKVLGPVILLLMLSNGATWWQYRLARAEADRAVAECNSDKLAQALADSELELSAAIEARRRLEQSLTEMDSRAEAAREELARTEAELLGELESARDALREVDLDESSCARTIVEPALWLRYREATEGGRQDAGGGGGGADVGADPG